MKKWYGIITTSVMLLLLYSGIGIQASNNSPLIVAHRGYSAVAPENTLPAFLLATQAGAQGWETDLQFTKDGQLVVMHDNTLDRTTNCTGYLLAYTYDELQNCDASYVNGKNFTQFRGTKIPLFSEVLELAKNLSMFIVMDYKSNVSIGSTLSNFVPQTGMTSQVFGSCWKDWQIQDIHDNLPGSPKQLLTAGVNAESDGFWDNVISTGVNGFSIQLTNISESFVFEAHSRLLSVAVWTVNDPNQMKLAITYGVDAILTDDVPTLKKVVDEANTPPPANIVVRDNIIGVHVSVVIGVAVVVFVLTAVSVGLAVYYIRRRSEYNRIIEGSKEYNFS